MSAVASSSSTNSLAMSGLASGIDWTSIINEMATAEEAPETQWETQQTTVNAQNTAYQTIGTDLATLQTDLTNLSDPSFFQSTTTTSSDQSVATATSQTGTPVGTYSLDVSTLGTASVQNGATVQAQPLSSSDDVSSLVLSDASLADPITAGTFTINGQTITVDTSDTLQSVFDQINTATNGAVTASYDSTTDEVSLTSSAPIELGSAADTSNFLQALQLYNNGGDSITSAGALGTININNPASSANLGTTISDGGNGQGEFSINGVDINYSASDSIADILSSINNSEAGVTATYDGINNRFVLTNNSTGNVGMSMQDITGNFLAATGLSGGTFVAGANLQYSINGGPTMTSTSNTVDASSLGLTGLSITAQSTGTTNLNVGSDTTSIASAITQFVTDYNTLQNYIQSQTTSSSTSSSSSTSTSSSSSTSTPGVLIGDMDAEGIATQLRELVNASPLSGDIQNINDIGISSNGTDNTLSANSIILNGTLTTNLQQVAQLFTGSSGIASSVSSYVTTLTSSNGILATKEQDLTSQSTALTTSITNLQNKVTSDEAEMQNEFVNMEDAINSINVDKEYLSAYFDSSAATTTAPVSQNNASSSSSSDSSSSSSGI